MAQDQNPETQTQCPFQPEAAAPDTAVAERLGSTAVYQTADIGPDSLLRHYLDTRIAFTGPSAGLLQLMDPGLGAGVTEHSKFFDEPIMRILRSTPQITGVATSPNGEALGNKIKEYHRDIKGLDAHGCRYHALNPKTFMWAHDTFRWMVEEVVDRFSRTELTPALREQLYAETNEWGRRYGVSMRFVPPTYDAYKEKWDHTLAHVLEKTEAAERALNIAQDPPRELTASLPNIVSRAAKLALLFPGETVRIITIGGLPEVVRERFEIPWSDRFDQPRLQALEVAVRNLWPRLPAHMRYPPQSRADHHAALRSTVATKSSSGSREHG